MFTALCKKVGLAIKPAKNEQGRVTCFAGVELDSRNMVIQLPGKKLQQRITGYLNFVNTVTPLGRTFLRRMYNMELYFPVASRHQSTVSQVRPRMICCGGTQYSNKHHKD